MIGFITQEGFLEIVFLIGFVVLYYALYLQLQNQERMIGQNNRMIDLLHKIARGERPERYE